MSSFKFIFYHNDKLVKKIVFTGTETRSVSIGRKDTDVLLPTEDVSKMHAQLLYDGSMVYILDCNSANGTFINDKALSGNQPLLLRQDDVVMFGKQGTARLLVTVTDEPRVNGNIDYTKTIINQLSVKNEIIIGREEDCDVVLDHSSVSRKHASVKKTNAGKYIVTDEGSLNGIFVNGARVKKAEVGVNDKLYIGRFQLSLEGIQRNLGNESAIRALAVSKKYKNGVYALKETTFDLPSGGVIAIMGPSGCGKSTLLKVLNGTIFPTTGSVYINGLDLIDHLPYLKTQIGYVPQDDIVHKELTVRQSIYYAAKIRLNNVSDEIIKKKTDHLLSKLNISKISDNLVSEISGGQRKRVSIAVELLSDPAILFLDEPTSPLDPQTIAEFMTILRNLSEGGTTVIMVTHKPEDLNYMDKVIFMAEGGSLAFYGNVTDYQRYFEVTTPLEVYSNISGDKAPFWVKKFTESLLLNSSLLTAKPIRKKDRTDAFSQFYWLFRRYLQIKQNNSRSTLFMLLQAPIIAMLICLVFKEVKLGVLFLTSISGIWFGINNSAREIVSESAVYQRERMFNLMIFPYMFSKIVMLAIFALLQSFLFISILYLLNRTDDTNSVSWVSWFPAICWMFFIVFSASILGLLISAASKTVEKAMAVVPIVIIPQIMLAGVVTIINSSIVELLSYFTLSRWGTEGFTHLQTKVVETSFNPIRKIHETKVAEKSFEVMKTNFHETYTMIFGKYAGTFELNIVILTFMSTILFAFAWTFLVKKDKNQI